MAKSWTAQNTHSFSVTVIIYTNNVTQQHLQEKYCTCRLIGKRDKL